MIWRGILKKDNKGSKKIATVLFYLYIIVLTYFLFFSEYLNRDQLAEEYRINTVFFQEIKRYFVHWRAVGLKSFMINIPGNILAFVPFGFFLPYIKKVYRRFWRVALLTFFFSQTIEVTQLVTKVGSFDVDDILLNTVGGMLGYLAYKVHKKIRNRKRKDSYGKSKQR